MMDEDVQMLYTLLSLLKLINMNSWIISFAIFIKQLKTKKQRVAK